MLKTAQTQQRTARTIAAKLQNKFREHYGARARIYRAPGRVRLGNSGSSVDRLDLARLCQRAENEFVGARVGIMDQLIACYGHAGNALKLDCRSLEYDLLPVPGDISLVICNTMVKHEHAGGEYNTRRAECEEGVRLLSRWLPNARSLRDVSLADLERHARGIPEVIYKRCRHVITENARVAEAADALERGDLPTFGRLMAESHHSLRNDYQVSCSELDLMVDLAKAQPDVFGTRMTARVFGDCTLSLVASGSVGEFAQNIRAEYQRFTGFSPQIFASAAAEGACEIEA